MSFSHDQPYQGDFPSKCKPAADFASDDSVDHNRPLAEGSLAGDNCPERPENIYDEEARFELLSAYVDNEVTAEERRLVGQWLRDDPAIQHMYQQLLVLRQAIRTAPVPPPPPLEVPTSPRVWQKALSSGVRWTLVCTTAIALFSGFSQIKNLQGRQSIYETWQWLRSLPQEPLFEFASTTKELPSERWGH